MIEDLHTGIETLVSLYETQKGRADELSSKLLLAESEIRKYKIENAELTDKVNKLELAAAFSKSSLDSADAKKRIDVLLEQIDKCIKMLEV